MLILSFWRHYSRGWQTIPGEIQTVSILGFAPHVVSSVERSTWSSRVWNGPWRENLHTEICKHPAICQHCIHGLLSCPLQWWEPRVKEGIKLGEIKECWEQTGELKWGTCLRPDESEVIATTSSLTPLLSASSILFYSI